MTDGRTVAARSQPVQRFAAAAGDGLFVIDTGYHRPRHDAAYLLVDDGRAAFIDTGTHHSVPRLLATLDDLGLQRDVVDWVIPTHVHLDHAGGVGRLMQELPRARLLVHPRGLRHMLDPSALYRGAAAVYGEEAMARTYGPPTGVEAARAATTHDGMQFEVGRRRLLVADTPGHALHHHCLWDEASGGWFCGDTFGVSYREFDRAGAAWVTPATVPVQFDPQALRSSIERLMQAQPRCVYLTHFGPVGDVARLAEVLLTELQEVVELALALRHTPQRHACLRDGLLALYLQSLRRHGCSLDDAACAALLEMDVELNAQGLGVWLDRG
jgi:glyoxylase-like metal-dependent hydrolase (beta-lactamase superfamily II)